MQITTFVNYENTIHVRAKRAMIIVIDAMDGRTLRSLCLCDEALVSFYDTSDNVCAAIVEGTLSLAMSLRPLEIGIVFDMYDKSSVFAYREKNKVIFSSEPPLATPPFVLKAIEEFF